MTNLTTNALFSVAGKVVLVTGGSRGIGEMMAAGFLANGAKVYITARKAEACDATAARLSETYDAECISIPANVAELDGIAAGKFDVAVAAMAEVDRLAELVDALLSLARLDASAGEIVGVDVGAVVAERVATWLPLAEERDLGLTVDDRVIVVQQHIGRIQSRQRITPPRLATRRYSSHRRRRPGLGAIALPRRWRPPRRGPPFWCATMRSSITPLPRRSRCWWWMVPMALATATCCLPGRCASLSRRHWPAATRWC